MERNVETWWVFDTVSVALAASERAYPIARCGGFDGNGFRVAYVPEPSCMILIFSAATSFVILWGKRRKKIVFCYFKTPLSKTNTFFREFA